MRIRLGRWFRFWLVLSLGVLVLGAQDEENYFGSGESAEAALIGIMYDLKQTQKRENSGINPNSYHEVVRQFLERNWDESVLNQYFRAARPLYTTRIFIPLMGAKNAPRAFDVEEVMKPSCWLVHYKGQVSPPRDGTYRFISYSDDLIVVSINGKIVSDGSRGQTRGIPYVRPKDQPHRIRAANGRLIFGEWVELKKDEPVDLDVLVGERPGGQFCAFLLYERKGETYTRDENGNPRYPVFRLSGSRISREFPPNQVPVFSQSDDPWVAYQ